MQQGSTIELDDAVDQKLGMPELFECVLLKFALNIATHGTLQDRCPYPVLVKCEPLLGQSLVEYLNYTVYIELILDDSYTFFCHSSYN